MLIYIAVKKGLQSCNWECGSALYIYTYIYKGMGFLFGCNSNVSSNGKTCFSWERSKRNETRNSQFFVLLFFS